MAKNNWNQDYDVDFYERDKRPVKHTSNQVKRLKTRRRLEKMREDKLLRKQVNDWYMD